MRILKYIIPAIVLKKVYQNKYANLSDEEIDVLTDMKDDA